MKSNGTLGSNLGFGGDASIPLFLYKNGENREFNEKGKKTSIGKGSRVERGFFGPFIEWHPFSFRRIVEWER